MSAEHYFLKNNGFEIENNTSLEARKIFISKIESDVKYYFEFFGHNNLLYVIPFSRKIFEKSTLLTNIYGNVEFPLFESNIISACSNVIDKNLFDVDYFIKTIIEIFIYINKEDNFSEELLKIEPIEHDFNNLRTSEKKLIKKLSSLGTLETEIFLNTHETLFKFFTYYDFRTEKRENIGFAILANVFRWVKFDRVYIAKYFGFSFGRKVMKNITATEKNILVDKIDKDHRLLYCENVHNHDDILYLRSNFLGLDFNSSCHVLTSEDEELKIIQKYILLNNDTYYRDFDHLSGSARTVKIMGFEILTQDVLNKISWGDNIEIEGNAKIMADNFTTKKTFKTIAIPNSIIKIGDNFMNYMHKLEYVVLSNSLIEIGNFFVRSCHSIKSIIFPESLKKIGNYFMKDCYSLESISLNSIEEIDDHFLCDCPTLKSVSIRGSLKKINSYFMSQCSNVESVVLPDSIDTIERIFMESCENIRFINMPKNLKLIGNNFMFNCRRLEKISFSDSLISIGNYFMDNCVNLKTIDLSNFLLKIGSHFMHCCSNLENIVLPKSLEKIDIFFMQSCEKVESIIIPDTVKTIPNLFMNNCKKLRTIILPGSLEIIGEWFMNGCKNLETIVFPKSVKSIGDYFMGGCDGLKIIKLPKSLDDKTKLNLKYVKKAKIIYY